MSSLGHDLYMTALSCSPQITRAKLSVNKIKTLLCGLFHSEYDDEIARAATSLLENTKCLYQHVQDDDCYNGDICKKLNAAILNAVKMILSSRTSDCEAATMQEFKMNYRFFFHLMKEAFRTGDHQTTM